MKHIKLNLFPTLVLCTSCMSQALVHAEQVAHPDLPSWKVANTYKEVDNVKVCLINQNGHWVEGDPRQANNCQEMVIAWIAGHSLRRDFDFHSPPGKRLDAYGILQAFNEAGAAKRLDAQYIEKNERCISQYNEATTTDQVMALRKPCEDYAQEALNKAQSRVSDNDEKRRQEKRESIAAKYRPKCSKVSFYGIVAGNDGDLDALRNATNVEDVVASHPLYCGPSGFTQTYVCEGAAVLAEKTGYIVSWSDKAYQVATPIDLQMGRKDALIYVSRADATCLDQTQPSLNFGTNLENFLKYHNTHR